LFFLNVKELFPLILVTNIQKSLAEAKQFSKGRVKNILEI